MDWFLKQEIDKQMKLEQLKLLKQIYFLKMSLKLRLIY